MQKFLHQVAIFLAIQLLIASVFYWNSFNMPQYGFMAAFEDKIKLLEEHDEPSLILIGGSNLIFGMDSSILEQEIGLPTINTGLHAGLGLQFFLDMAEKYARPGDVILLSPEYPLLSSRLNPSEQCSHSLIRQSPTGWRHLLSNPGFDLKGFVDNRGLNEIAFHLQSGMKHYDGRRAVDRRKNALEPGAYSRLNFNANGDFVGHHGQPQADELRDINRRFYFFPSYYAKTTAAINTCAEAVEAKGAKMYFSYSPIPESIYERSQNALAKAHEYLQQHLSIPILHTPQQTLYSESCFYDTSCHLNETTKYERTRLIANRLKRQFMVLSHQQNRRSKLR